MSGQKERGFHSPVDGKASESTTEEEHIKEEDEVSNFLKAVCHYFVQIFFAWEMLVGWWIM